MTLEQMKELPPDIQKELINKISGERSKGKTTNYSATYGAMPPTISKAAKVSIREAEDLYKGYWEKNWAIKAIANAQTIKVFSTYNNKSIMTLYKGADITIEEDDNWETKKKKRAIVQNASSMWLLNPLSNKWHSLRYPKDIFSTLNQSSGVVAFDMWIREFRKKRSQLTGQMHDEVILTLKKGYRTQCEKLLKDAIKVVNEKLNLNRELDVDVQFGDNYAQIH